MTPEQKAREAQLAAEIRLMMECNDAIRNRNRKPVYSGCCDHADRSKMNHSNWYDLKRDF